MRLLVFLFIMSLPLSIWAMDKLPVELSSGEINIQIKAEVANTADLRNKGLQHRSFLPMYEGMLFTWPEKPEGKAPKNIAFWMKDTPAPLIIIFAQNGMVIDAIQAEPFSEKLISPSGRFDTVLEISAKHPLAQKIAPGWALKVGKSEKP